MQGTVLQSQAYETFYPGPPLNRWVHCFWQLNVPIGSFHYLSIPDNCVDWIFNLDEPEDGVLVPPFAQANSFELSGPVTYFGIRFQIHGHSGLTNIPLHEWNAEITGDNIADIMSEETWQTSWKAIQQTSFLKRCQHLSEVLLGQIQYSPMDKRLFHFLRFSIENGEVELSDKQISQFGLSSRQLRRLSHQYLGLSPKQFLQIIQFQNALKHLENSSLQDPRHHYYDQAHYIRQFKRFTGVTPGEFKTMSVLYNSST